jgi:hypothetical protein
LHDQYKGPKSLSVPAGQHPVWTVNGEHYFYKEDFERKNADTFTLEGDLLFITLTLSFSISYAVGYGLEVFFSFQF